MFASDYLHMNLTSLIAYHLGKSTYDRYAYLNYILLKVVCFKGIVTFFNFEQPETFVKVRPRCEAPRRDMVYPTNYTPCRYVRISCLRGNPIAIFFIQVRYRNYFCYSIVSVCLFFFFLRRLSLPWHMK